VTLKNELALFLLPLKSCKFFDFRDEKLKKCLNTEGVKIKTNGKSDDSYLKFL
jgi:hypothetical protein